jgi:hypothetical protein
MANPNHSNRSTAPPLHSPYCTISHTEVSKLSLAKPKHPRTDSRVEKSWSCRQGHFRPSASKRYYKSSLINTPTTSLIKAIRTRDLLRTHPRFLRRNLVKQQDIRNVVRGLRSSAATLENGNSLVEAVGYPTCERQQAGCVEDYILREDRIQLAEVLGVEDVSQLVAGLCESFDGGA